MRAVITVVGHDKPGIIAAVSTSLAERGVNILDISQTILQGNFTMMMLTDYSKMEISIQQLRDDLHQLGEKIELTITVQHEGVFQAMHRI
ncbi:MAG: ACT domain-containing protein [Spirochaetaceae bacterium]|nr:MAG: ACT domain-containing protein [Spirochaetaceae bacterium]